MLKYRVKKPGLQSCTRSRMLSLMSPTAGGWGAGSGRKQICHHASLLNKGTVGAFFLLHVYFPELSTLSLGCSFIIIKNILQTIYAQQRHYSPLPTTSQVAGALELGASEPTAKPQGISAAPSSHSAWNWPLWVFLGTENEPFLLKHAPAIY